MRSAVSGRGRDLVDAMVRGGLEPARRRRDERGQDDVVQRPRPVDRPARAHRHHRGDTELTLPQPHVVRLEARPANAEGVGAVPVRELVRTALRMRPDRLIVGEVRGGEALDMLQALNTGHDGSLSTMHANGPAAALARLETLTLFAGVALPVSAVRSQIAAAIDAVVHVGRRRGRAAGWCSPSPRSRPTGVPCRSSSRRRRRATGARRGSERPARRPGVDLLEEWRR